MKTSELTGIALDLAVDKAQGRFCLYPCASYSTNWAQGGPIIEQEKIAVNYDHTGRRIDCWTAACASMPLTWATLSGPTPLIAAMRCYVASKLGDDIEIPEGIA